MGWSENCFHAGFQTYNHRMLLYTKYIDRRYNVFLQRHDMSVIDQVQDILELF